MAPRRHPWHVIPLVAGMLALLARWAHAQDGKAVDFDASFLPGGAAMTVDLSRFRRGNAVLPGVYEVDLWLNDEWQARRSMRFVEREPGSDAVPCLARAELERAGLAATSIPGDDDPCEPLGRRVPGARTHLDVAEQRLDVEIPQALLVRRRRGVPPRHQWARGIAAGLLGWRLNMQDASSRGRHRRSMFLADDAGLNMGPWRLRHSGAMTARRYRSTQTFLQHPFEAMDASWRVGDLSLAVDLFEPLRGRGIQLASDARMNPRGTLGYTPVVRGVSSSRARVRISQGGTLLREVSVPAGPFVLDDLPASAQGGHLVVDIEEERGGHRQMRVPYSPMPELLSESEHRFAVAVGHSQAAGRRDAPLVQALWRQGFSHGVTLYAGHRRLRDDRWLAAGAAIDTRHGGFSLDGMQASGPRGRSGESRWRGRYGVRWRDDSLFSASVTHGITHRGVPNRRKTRMPRARRAREQRIDMLYQRSLGEGGGALGVGLSYLSRSGDASVSDLALTWSRLWASAALDLSVRRRRRGAAGDGRSGATEGQVSVSVPLGGGARHAQARFAWRADEHGGEWQAGVTGATRENRGWGYAASMASGKATGERLDASASRASGGGDIGLAISRSTGSSSASLSASGAAIVHAGGVTLAPHLGEAMGLVRARHATGARLAASSVGQIDRRGYAVLPDLAPYRWNHVDIDPTGLPLGITFGATQARVVPTAGAIVLLPFDTEAHPTVLIAGRMRDGTPLPFGAEVIDGQGRSMGFVGQGGRALVRWDEPPLPITVRWSGAGAGRCVLSMTAVRQQGTLEQHEGDCQ
ncbi:fimbria/pilus outer membrane usher protein [Xanthomonas sp. NCPPB 2632]|uniref:fimbria/pilus outer membrane usher protein n=1 Tax=Xanthomonas sp. NCPPB 2632 TaxID=3240912 RepID=UPI0035194D12